MSSHSQSEKVTRESLDSSPCLDVILSSLQPFFLVTEIFLQFIKPLHCEADCEDENVLTLSVTEFYFQDPASPPPGQNDWNGVGPSQPEVPVATSSWEQKENSADLGDQVDPVAKAIEQRSYR